jgi:hypothetical protein
MERLGYPNVGIENLRNLPSSESDEEAADLTRTWTGTR